MKIPKFLIGLLVGTLLAAAFWYWQKSTSAEDGALEVLDRLAASEARLRDLQRQTAAGSQPPPPAYDDSLADDLRLIEGIGPTYAKRLHDAGITSFEALAALPAEQLVEITGVRSMETAVEWIVAAESRSTR